MKTLKLSSAVLLALAALLSLGALTAAAQGPTSVAYLDNQSHSIGPNASQLFRFDYAVDTLNNIRPVTTITLVNGTNSGLGFQVWTPDTVNDMADNKPVGQGTAATVDCTTGEPSAQGQCQAPDLTWSGAFGESNPYYVLITNSMNNAMNYQLLIQGSGVSLGTQLASAPSAPAAAPAASAATINLDDPAKATVIDNASHSIPAGSAVWYSFSYNLNEDGTRPVQTITFANGTNSGVSFQVWSPDSLNGGWWNNTPTGQGTAATVDCTTGEPSAQGQCQAPDLTWSGAFGAPGTYYVRVINGNTAPADVTLTIK